MSTYTIICPNCNSQLSLTMTPNQTLCEICSCGFPENAGIKEWSVA